MKIFTTCPQASKSKVNPPRAKKAKTAPKKKPDKAKAPSKTPLSSPEPEETSPTPPYSCLVYSPSDSQEKLFNFNHHPDPTSEPEQKSEPSAPEDYQKNYGISTLSITFATGMALFYAYLSGTQSQAAGLPFLGVTWARVFAGRAHHKRGANFRR
ncbi:hypothetical protein DSO57_1000809 [Entomophthora muscae]|uniref:Uncharacterized protein n=1 Tax=Entomophthora muscae TaxID=34485 RepID=A0ACC2U710_9FUNG|nr:hypothetical protein DSO57_1000809 [Entomophthora muscae]